MNGKEFRSNLFRLGIRPIDLANHLGVPSQSLSQTFNAQDVKTGMLEKAAAYKGISPASFYLKDDDRIITSITNSNAAIGEGASVTQDNPSVVAALLVEMSELRKQNARLIDMIAKGGKIG